MNLMIAMKQSNDLTPAERQIVNFILANPEQATKLKIKELAKKSFTSSSTVLRVIRKFGIESYIDFRIHLAEDVYDYLQSTALMKERAPLEFESSIQSIVENVSTFNIMAIESSIKINEATVWKNISKLMTKYPVIDFYGVGHSNIIAQDAVMKSLRLGIHASTFQDTSSQLIASRIANSSRLAFLISYTGENSTIIQVAKNLMKTGTPTISFTSNTNNSLISLCNYNLFVDTTDSIYAIGHMSSRIAFLNIFDILFTVYANENYPENMKTLEKTYNYMKPESEEK